MYKCAENPKLTHLDRATELQKRKKMCIRNSETTDIKRAIIVFYEFSEPKN